MCSEERVRFNTLYVMTKHEAAYFAAGVADAGGRPDAGQAHHRHPLPCSRDERSLGPEPVPALVDKVLQPPQVLAKPHLYSTVQYSTVQYSTVQPHLHLGECELVARVSALVGHIPSHRQPQRSVSRNQVRATVEFSNFNFGCLGKNFKQPFSEDTSLPISGWGTMFKHRS